MVGRLGEQLHLNKGETGPRGAADIRSRAALRSAFAKGFKDWDKRQLEVLLVSAPEKAWNVSQN